MPQITLTYNGTSPATICTITSAPEMGELTVRKVWMSPQIKAAAGENTFVYDNGIVKLFHEINCGQLSTAEKAALLAIIAAVGGISNVMDYNDSAGNDWEARFWNADDIISGLVRNGRWSLPIVLALTELNYLTDASGNRILDASGKYITVKI